MRTRLGLMALKAGVFERHAMRCLTGQVRIVAGDAGHFALLKALALTKRNDLISHPIAFTSMRVDRAVVVLKLFAWAEAQRWAFMVH